MKKLNYICFLQILTKKHERMKTDNKSRREKYVEKNKK